MARFMPEQRPMDKPRPSYWDELSEEERADYVNYQPWKGEQLLDQIHGFLKRFVAYPQFVHLYRWRVFRRRARRHRRGPG